MTSEQRIVTCALGGTPHLIDDECRDAVDTEPIGPAGIATKWCAHGPAHSHGEGGRCPYEPGSMPQPHDYVPEQRVHDGPRACAICGLRRAAGVHRAQPAQPAQQADAPPLIDLVRQYGNAEYRDGSAGLDSESSATRELFDRIAALAPALPVQARDAQGNPLWLSATGAVVHHGEQPDLSGPWRQLLVAGAAPAGDRAPEVHCEKSFPHQPHSWLWANRDEVTCAGTARPMPVLPAERALFHAAVAWRSSLAYVPRGAEPLMQAIEAAMDAQLDDTCGSCGRPNPPDGCAVNCGNRMDDALAHRDSDLIAQVMAELGVDRPEGVLKALGDDRALIKQLAETGQRLKDERDEARALAEQRGARLTQLEDDRRAALIELDEARAKINQVLARWEVTVAERDEVRAKLDALEEVADPPAPEGKPRTAVEIWRAIGEDGRDRVAHGIDGQPELAAALDREAGL